MPFPRLKLAQSLDGPSLEDVAVGAVRGVHNAMSKNGAAHRAPFLSRAVIRKSRASTTFLASVGADVDRQDSWGLRPLDWACALEPEGRAWAVEALLAAGADPSRKGACGRNALHWACVAGHPSVDAVIGRMRGGLDEKDGDGMRPLALAIAARSFAAALSLIGAGARVDALSEVFIVGSDRWRLTPLAMAMDMMGPTAAVCVPVCQDAEMEKALADHARELHALDLQAEDSNRAVVAALLAAGANVNMPCFKARAFGIATLDDRRFPAWTRLFRAFASERDSDKALVLAETLFEAGWSEASRCVDGRNGLHWAAVMGQPRVARMLVARGWDPTAVDDMGDSAAFLALMHGQRPLATELEAACERWVVSAAVGGATKRRGSSRL